MIYTTSAALMECQTLLEVTGLTHCLIRIVDTGEAGNIQSKNLCELLDNDRKVCRK